MCSFLQNTKLLLACKMFLGYMFLILHHLYCFPTSVLWFLTIAPLKYCWPTVYWTLLRKLIHGLSAVVTSWTWISDYDIVEMGDDLTRCLDDRTLVLINHQSAADVVMLVSAFSTRHVIIDNSLWIMNDIFKYTSFGVIAFFREDHFILTGRKTRELGLLKLKQHLRESYVPLKRKLIMLFPEGGFLYRRQARNKKYALENNLPILNHVTLPRLGAVSAILDECGPKKTQDVADNVSVSSKAQVLNTWVSVAAGERGVGRGSVNSSRLKWVLDVTMAYEDGVPIFISTILGSLRKPCQTILFYRLYPADEVPIESEELTSWLYNRWQEKEEILAKFYATGKMPVYEFCADPIPTRKINHSPRHFILAHIFYIISSYFHYQILSLVFTSVW